MASLSLPAPAEILNYLKLIHDQFLPSTPPPPPHQISKEFDSEERASYFYG